MMFVVILYVIYSKIFNHYLITGIFIEPTTNTVFKILHIIIWYFYYIKFVYFSILLFEYIYNYFALFAKIILFVDTLNAMLILHGLPMESTKKTTPWN